MRADSQRVQFAPGNWVAPAGSYRGGGGGNETVGAFETDVSLRRCSEPTGRNASERRAGLETTNVVADLGGLLVSGVIGVSSYLNEIRTDTNNRTRGQ